MAEKTIGKGRNVGAQTDSSLSAKQPVAQERKKFNFRFIRTQIDKPFFILLLVLLAFGMIMMFSASYASAINKYGDGYYYLKKQLQAAGLGLVAMFALSFLDYHFFQNTKVAFLAFALTWVLSMYTAFFGVSTADAKRWIYIGRLQLQPSELLKVAFIIIFAYIMSVNFPKFKDWKYCVIPFTVILGLVAIVLVFQRHMSAVLLVGIIGISMMFVSGMPKKTFWIFIGCCLGAGLILVLYKVFATGDFNYILDRFQSWKDPTSDISNTTLQTYQSILAIGSGGMFGLGFLESRQKYLYLPESQNDFVFAIICEELGFVGALAVIILFLMFTIRGFYVASHAKDRFGMLLGTGIIMQIGSQAFLNIAVASNAFPNTGISLPFFSYGGTALLIQLAEMGIFLNISRQAKLPK